MPIYEYECDECGIFLREQSMTDAPLEVCPKCGAPAHRIPQAPAVIYRADGFYTTDHREEEHE